MSSEAKTVLLDLTDPSSAMLEYLIIHCACLVSPLRPIIAFSLRNWVLKKFLHLCSINKFYTMCSMYKYYI